MPRVFRKMKNRGGHKVYQCSAPKCKMKSRDVLPGQEYLTWKFNRGSRYFRHVECGMPRRSELSQSKMGPVWDAADDFDIGTCTTPEDISAALSVVAEAARQVAQEYGEAAENIIMAFPSGNATSEACGATGDELDSWADALEAWEADPAEYDTEQFDTEEHWLEAIREQAQDLVNEQPEYQG